EESVLERAGILLDHEQEEIVSPAGGPGSTSEEVRPVNPEELEKMSAFKDFIESLDLDDFEKRK
ncbi:MAG TPA: bifunctional nuclease family protein, partial [Dehalococcoidia bacterium]|nr:bifunctional nuclease family protein [Dehalococcoidia bacterium]